MGYCHPIIPAGLEMGQKGTETEDGHVFAVTYKENIFQDNKYIYTGMRRICRLATSVLGKLVILGPTRLLLSAVNFRVEDWKYAVHDIFPNNSDSSSRNIRDSWTKELVKLAFDQVWIVWYCGLMYEALEMYHFIHKRLRVHRRLTDRLKK